MSVTEHYTDRSLAARIALIEMVGFVVASWSATFLDGQLAHHVLFNRARTYPLGFGILIFSPLFFLLTYLSVIVAPARALITSWLPSVIAAAFFLPNFEPEVPHIAYSADVAGYALLAFLTVLTADVSQVPSETKALAIEPRARARRLEEAIKDWRAILFVVVTTYVLAVLGWLQILWPVADHLTENATERWILGATFGAKAFIFSIMVIAGPVLELYRALKRHQHALFELEAGNSLVV